MIFEGEWALRVLFISYDKHLAVSFMDDKYFILLWIMNREWNQVSYMPARDRN